MGIWVVLVLLLSPLMSVGHSGYSQNPLTVNEVVGDTWVMVSLHLALLDFTRDAQHSWQGKQSCWDHSPQLLNLLGANVGHYRS